MLTEIVFLKKYIIDEIELTLKNYIIDIIHNEEEFDTFMEFYFKDNVEFVFDKFINYYYENAYSYDNNSFDEKLKKVFHDYKAAELKYNTGPNLNFIYDYDYDPYARHMDGDNIENHRHQVYFTYSDYFNHEILCDIIVQLFDENQTRLK